MPLIGSFYFPVVSSSNSLPLRSCFSMSAPENSLSIPIPIHGGTIKNYRRSLVYQGIYNHVKIQCFGNLAVENAGRTSPVALFNDLASKSQPMQTSR